MNRVSVARLPSAPSGSSACSDFSSPSYPPFPTPENDSGPAYTSDDVTPLFYKPPASEGEGEAAKELDEETGAEIRTVHNMKGGQGGNPKAHDARRSWFGKKENREKVTLGPQDVVTADFFNGFVSHLQDRTRIPDTKVY